LPPDVDLEWRRRANVSCKLVISINNQFKRTPFAKSCRNHAGNSAKKTPNSKKLEMQNREKENEILSALLHPELSAD
jgi:hypothetical protein